MIRLGQNNLFRAFRLSQNRKAFFIFIEDLAHEIHETDEKRNTILFSFSIFRVFRGQKEDFIMLDVLANLERTHTCGELRAENVGESVVLMGWTAKKRDFGNRTIIF